MRNILINFLLEENKFTSLRMKDSQEKLLKTLSIDKLFTLVLEKARSQGRDQALEFYSHQSKAPKFDYSKVKKKS